MSSNAITEQRDDKRTPGGPGGDELAPSIVREDEYVLGRWIGAFGLVLAVVGGVILLWSWWAARVLPLRLDLLAALFLSIGLLSLVFHSITDRDLQIRRTYGVFGGLWLVTGAVLILLSLLGIKAAAGLFVPGACFAAVGLVFLLAFIRNETETDWRDGAAYILGGAGAVGALVAFVGSNLHDNFLVPNGCVLALVSLAFLLAFVSVRWTDDAGRLGGLAILILGAVVFLVAVVRSFLFAPYAIPNGALLGSLGLLYAGAFALIWLDTPLLVLTRRELAGFFYSPVAYVVLIVSTGLAWLAFALFMQYVAFPRELRMQPLIEPIVADYLWGLFSILTVMFIVPLLTMRSLSEEKRTGTMEVLLTVPVEEWAVVLSKFLATLVFFLLTWLPWALFLLGLYVGGGQAFDYRPLLSFLVALVCSGAAFIAMGLFFSSVTRNQIIAAVLTLAGMFALLGIYVGARLLEPTNPWVPILQHMSFVDLWRNSLEGKLQPQFLLFQVSMAIFWLFLTVKVLEARKWS